MFFSVVGAWPLPGISLVYINNRWPCAPDRSRLVGLIQRTRAGAVRPTECTRGGSDPVCTGPTCLSHLLGRPHTLIRPSKDWAPCTKGWRRNADRASSCFPARPISVCTKDQLVPLGSQVPGMLRADPKASSVRRAGPLPGLSRQVPCLPGWEEDSPELQMGQTVGAIPGHPASIGSSLQRWVAPVLQDHLRAPRGRPCYAGTHPFSLSPALSTLMPGFSPPLQAWRDHTYPPGIISLAASGTGWCQGCRTLSRGVLQRLHLESR